MANTVDCGYRPISDYAIIGDAHMSALVARDGSIDWCCWPHFDSPAVLCRLLDARRGGWFRVAPTKPCQIGREYLDRTNVLATTFTAASGRIRLVDFMPARARNGWRGKDIEESHTILRLVEGLGGDVHVTIQFKPTFDYARAAAAIELRDQVAIARGKNCALRLTAPVQLSVRADGTIVGALRVRTGERWWIALTDEDDRRVVDPQHILDATLQYWRDWDRRCSYHGPYEAHVRRSALALKLLTFEPTGAVIAAPTTSLPEEIGGVRNWDYRFTWLRDASLTLYSLMSIGHHDEAMDFWKWLERICLSCHDEIQIMYRVDGSRELPEQLLPHLDGYRRSRPVRIGNAAAGQKQLDVYGEVLDAAHFCYERMRTPHSSLWSVIAGLADRAAARWQEPDQGIWEVRTGPRHFLYSKLLCWVALDRAVKLSERERIPGDAAAWRRTRAEIRRVILTRGYNRTLHAFTQAFDNTALDASALVVPLVGFLPAMDPRVQSTIRVIQERLTAGGLVYRYLGDDGLPGAEATFALCSFWLVDNLALSGRLSKARKLFEQLIGYANDVGLMSEQVDPTTGGLLGNFPQGFTHLALIRSALHIAKSERGGAEQRAERPAERQREAAHVAEQDE